ncbi:MAG: polymerase sigma factor FliA [Eubacteriales bacterium]|nr:polymerase sigma factor FliA [Eubacteriales bacterium]MDN5364160.1 polymerase sigma factor FliA [Eubacteriales bacterium]
MLGKAKKSDDDGILACWQRFKSAGDQAAREALIVHYAPLVKYVANRIAATLPATVERQDLISYGIFGLIDAIEKFEPERGIRFETYALARIKGAILDGLRAMDWVPYLLRQKARELEEAYASIEARTGRPATDEEVCQVLGLTKKQFYNLLRKASAACLVSLDDLLQGDKHGDNKTRLLDWIEDSSSPDPIAFLELKEQQRILAEAINRLPEKEKTVIALYYYEGLTLKEIGRVLGVSESRVSQLHTRAILRMRGYLNRKRKKLS